MEAVLYSGPNDENEQELVTILQQANIIVNQRRITDLNDENLQLLKNVITKNLLSDEIVIIVARSV
jgi:hypothetical protein